MEDRSRKPEEFEARIRQLDELWQRAYDEVVPRHTPRARQSMKQVLHQRVARHPQRSLIIDRERSFSYSEAHRLACRLANALLGMGAQPGDRVVLNLPNCAEIVIGYLACYEAGFVAVGLNPRTTTRELVREVRDCSPSVIITHSQYCEPAREVLASGLTSVQHVVVVDAHRGDCDLPGVHDYEEILVASSDAEPGVAVGADDVQYMPYTGGTTGVSKGCCHSSANIINHALAFDQWFAPAIGGAELRVLMALPLTHAYGVSCGINWPLVCGGTCIIVSDPKIENVLADIRDFGPTVWPTVPAMLNQVVRFENQLASANLDLLRLIICGSAPCPVETLRVLRTVTTAEVVEGYGMSESVNAITFNPAGGGGKPGTVGLPIQDTDVLVVDVDTGTELMDFTERGEIIFRGYQQTLGYWQNAVETSNAIRDGWLYTGDIGSLDPDGFLRILDRKKDMITSGGFNVFPTEIDSFLFEHPQIFSACSIGVPDEKRGEVLKSFVVPMPGSGLTTDDVVAYCRAGLTAYKVPRIIEFVDEIPMTKVNKPDREALRAQERDRAASS